jgi:uncharacterized protein (TIGR02996 family)
MSDGDALLRAILLRPDDDTARLVYADWLQENDGNVPCEVCARKGCECPQHVPNHYANRAALIRVQCELARLRGNATRRAELVFRENQLHDAHALAWAPVPCPVCEGSGNQPGDAYDLGRCDGCDGDGYAPLEWERGFVVAVRCRMGDVLRWSNSEAWTLTPWARAVADAHPVERWEIVDREPWHVSGTNRLHWWVDADREQPVDGVPETCLIPRAVMLAMPDEHRSPSNRRAVFVTAALARAALAFAVGRVARRIAGLPG